MDLTGLHILLTYQCNYECDHCFVWGSPWQSGAFTLAQLDEVFHQAREVPTIHEVYFEGGEAFLYYPVLREAIGRATRRGYRTGIVSNAYWATGREDAWMWLQPLAAAGLKQLDLSGDAYHGSEQQAAHVRHAQAAARELFLSVSTIAIEPPAGLRDPAEARPGLPLAGGGVMFRGRAAERLTAGLPAQPWDALTCCPYEELAEPGRLHLDPLGNLHLCQGLVIGNLFERPLKRILEEFIPEEHPIAGPLLAGGPAGLVRRYDLPHEPGYVDACHLCYTARKALRDRFPAELGPDQMYGVAAGQVGSGAPL
jgi:hypothetical protein